MEDKLNIDDYPQMRLLAWNRVVRVIEADVAFALYEANWRFVDQDELTVNEAALINRLIKQYGKGILNPHKNRELYDKWLMDQVQEALDDDSPTIPHEQAIAEVRAALKFTTTKKNLKC